MISMNTGKEINRVLNDAGVEVYEGSRKSCEEFVSIAGGDKFTIVS